MSERVAVASSRSPALALSHTRLGSDQDVVWFAVADAQLLAMWALDRSLQLIYFSRTDHDAAVAQLNPSERSEAIAYRRTRFTPLAEAFRCALERRHDALAPAAQAGRRDLFDRAMALLARWFGKRRFERAQPAFLLTRLVERETRLWRELATASCEDLATASAAHARQLAEALARHGSPEYARALPYVGLERGVSIVPGADLAEQLDAYHEPYVVIDATLFAPWSLDDLPLLLDEGRAVTVLYGGRGAFMQALDGTPPQWNRDLSARLAVATHAPAVPLEEHLIELRIEQSLFKLWTAAVVAATDPVLTRDLTLQIAADESHLYAALAASAPLPDPVTELHRLDTALRDDLTLFSAMARADQNDALAADLAELAAQLATEEGG